jgi:nucleoside phosphorylase
MPWLVAAHEKEIPGFHEFAQGGWQTHALGVGQFDSLAAFAALAASQKPDSVVLAGTCGSLYKEDIFQLFQCQHFAVPSITDEDLPEFLTRAVQPAEAVSFTELRRATVLQNHGISLSSEKFTQNTGYIPPAYPRPILENMEASSLALYCTKHGIPFTALLCVTNAIGPDGRRAWKENFRKAGEILAESLSRYAPLPGPLPKSGEGEAESPFPQTWGKGRG